MGDQEKARLLPHTSAKKGGEKIEKNVNLVEVSLTGT